MSIIFAGSNFIIKNKFWKYALIVFLAALCHPSALVMLPIYFFIRRRVDYKQWLMLIGIGVIMITSYNLLFKISEIILDKQMMAAIPHIPYMTKRVNILRVAVSWAPLFIYYMVREVYSKDPESNFYINMLLINAILRAGTINSAYLMRITSYTGIFSSLAIPRLIECFDKKSSILLKITILGLYIIFWYIEVSKTPNLYHYKWIFSR
jgi:transmembrane protein EpsG